MRFALRFNRIRSANCIEEGSVKRLSRHKAAHRRGASLFIPRPLDLGKEMETIDYSVCYPLTNVAGPEIRAGRTSKKLLAVAVTIKRKRLDLTLGAFFSMALELA